ncbi:MAG: NusG domain II-containing protein [Oscillospiraceae bacterium]|jgi:hypothetical protein|nr:NusG domain II-containing protein [Oscillospiraceae bacterium]
MRKRFGLTKPDLVLIAILLIISGLGFVQFPGASLYSERVTVSVNGEFYAELPLGTDATLEIAGFNGTHNTLLIKNGRVGVIAADCPDKLCMEQHEPLIICLPNRVAIAVSND